MTEPSSSPANHPASPSLARRRWDWADLIDFEFFLDQDQGRPAAELEARDRHLGFGHADGSQPGESNPGSVERRLMFRNWLEARRRSWTESAPLPGAMAVEAWRLGQRILGVGGLVLGAGAAAELLRYDGIQPVNVAAFLGWLVLLQILLALAAAGSLLLRKAGGLVWETSWLTSLARWAWTGLASWMNRHALDRVSGDLRLRVRSFLGTFAGKRSLYGRVLVWPILGAWQRFGVGFNIGALAATLALVLFSDRAFGWQSAMNITPRQIESLVAGLAFPWSWALPDAAGPTLDQIEGSRIILKDGIKQLVTANLVSWWPFLCMALAVYGLIPRVVLWVWAAVQQSRALNRLSFDHAAGDRLFARLTAGRIETGGVGDQPERSACPPDHRPWPQAMAAGPTATLPAGHVVVVANDEIAPTLPTDALSNQVTAVTGWRVACVLSWPESTADRDRVLAELAGANWEDRRPKLVLIEEGWQPPIAEKLEDLRAWRDALGSDAALVLFLLGRPRGTDVLTEVRPAERQVWEREVAALGDPNLRVAFSS